MVARAMLRGDATSCAIATWQAKARSERPKRDPRDRPVSLAHPPRRVDQSPRRVDQLYFMTTRCNSTKPPRRRRRYEDDGGLAGWTSRDHGVRNLGPQ